MGVHRIQGLGEAAGFQSDFALQPVYAPNGEMRIWQRRVLGKAVLTPCVHPGKSTSCFSFFSGGPPNSSGWSLQRWRSKEGEAGEGHMMGWAQNLVRGVHFFKIL